MAAVIRNRLNFPGFKDNGTYKGLISRSQFDSVGNSLYDGAASRTKVGNTGDYDVDVSTASSIFNRMQGDPTGQCVFFISPTASEMDGVNSALATGTTTYPASLHGKMVGSGGSNAWQVVVVSSVEANTNRGDPKRFGQPAFIFSRKRSPSDHAVVKF